MASRHALAALALALALSLALIATAPVAHAAPLPADNPSPAIIFSRPALVAVAPPPLAAHATNRDVPPLKRLPDFQAKHPLGAPRSADQVHVRPIAVPNRNVPVGVISARDILAPSHAPAIAAAPKRGGGGSLLWNALSARFQAPCQRQRAVRAAAAGRTGSMLMHAVDAADHTAASASASPAASCDADAPLAPPAAPHLDELLAEALKEATLVFTKPRVRVEL
ncbi:hypothetical protein AMAG_08227 [Allomyces macrogynus ATCC 38327]|uniref:Uncharacterized protein n=1 Tax=Allomyces macrogynus (strain ATCC 38327) TaxID=578462 RepID=A0A0L0SKJ3_ALLM3|nr:hypothetical protein AMAG_08227 [Allomyces macrogynus ATCC 38327]|eukprot:KNE63061.1 hypothetical protein AMAG_08227 [Allomyces macrogynus ATCC 38327]